MKRFAALAAAAVLAAMLGCGRSNTAEFPEDPEPMPTQGPGAGQAPAAPEAPTPN